MSELSQALGSIIENTEPTPQSNSSRHHIFAALFSACIPGSGQWLLGQRRKAAILILSFAVVVIGFWPLRLLRFYAGLCAVYSGWIAVYLYAACSAQLAPSSASSRRPSKWWLLATVPFAFVTISLLGRGITRIAGFRSFSVPSTSMEPAIEQGDYIVVDSWSYRSRPPSRPDVVIFNSKGIFFVKRVVGVGGETIEGREQEIFVNDRRLEEDYVTHRRPESTPWMDNFEAVGIPDGKYFVMGDNRDVSLDSRSADFGLVDRSSVVGKALYVMSSPRQGTHIQ